VFFADPERVEDGDQDGLTVAKPPWNATMFA